MRGAKLAGARDLTIATDWSTRSESDGVEVEEEEEDFLLGMLLQDFLWTKGEQKDGCGRDVSCVNMGGVCRAVGGGQSKGERRVCRKEMQ